MWSGRMPDSEAVDDAGHHVSAGADAHTVSRLRRNTNAYSGTINAGTIGDMSG